MVAFLLVIFGFMLIARQLSIVADYLEGLIDGFSLLLATVWYVSIYFIIIYVLMA